MYDLVLSDRNCRSDRPALTVLTVLTVVGVWCPACFHCRAKAKSKVQGGLAGSMFDATSCSIQIPNSKFETTEPFCNITTSSCRVMLQRCNVELLFVVGVSTVDHYALRTTPANCHITTTMLATTTAEAPLSNAAHAMRTRTPNAKLQSNKRRLWSVSHHDIHDINNIHRLIRRRVRGRLCLTLEVSVSVICICLGSDVDDVLTC